MAESIAATAADGSPANHHGPLTWAVQQRSTDIPPVRHQVREALTSGKTAWDQRCALDLSVADPAVRPALVPHVRRVGDERGPAEEQPPADRKRSWSA